MSSLHSCLRRWLPVCAVVFYLGGYTAHAEDKPSADKITEWRKAAEQGNADAQFSLGQSYSKGEGVVKDEVEAAKWFRKAAEQGDASAQLRIGACYADGTGVVKDDVEAVKWYRKSAEQGDALSQFCLGFCYYRGEGVVKDEVEAAKWFCKSAEQGKVEAQFILGTLYQEGEGVTKDDVEAAKWYRKSAEQGDALAQFYLGLSYANGRGVKKDNAVATKWFRKSAEQGDASAQNNLGVCYGNGQGVAKDYVEAAKWFRKAAEQGNAEAQNNLATRYHYGEGVVKNHIEGYKWTLLSAAQGHKISKKNMPIVESQLSSAQRAVGQRLAQEWEAKHAKREAGQGSERRPVTESSDAEPKITGTGFLITKNGYLVTNYHVVKDSDKVRVQTASGLLNAVVIRTDAASDLALLKVLGTFDALPVVSSRNSRLGSTVATVGFPNIGLQGFEPKLSKGDISSLAGIQDDVKQFQISVPIQHGNSGGALVDERGNVVGVVCAQLSQKAALETTGTLAQNVNYAIKSSYLLSFLEAVPEVSGGLLEAKTNDQKFEAVVDDVKKATVLIIGY